MSYSLITFKVFQSIISNEIFYCNFDDTTSLTSQCGGSTGLVGLGTATPSILANEFLTIGALVTSITDVKSLSRISLLLINFKLLFN